MNIDKMEALNHDPEFQNALEKVDSKDGFAKLLADHGIQFAEDELKRAGKEAKAELAENELETVAGGALAPVIGYYYWMWNWLLRRRSSGSGNGGLSAGGGGGSGGGGSGGSRF